MLPAMLRPRWTASRCSSPVGRVGGTTRRPAASPPREWWCARGADNGRGWCRVKPSTWTRALEASRWHVAARQLLGGSVPV